MKIDDGGLFSPGTRNERLELSNGTLQWQDVSYSGITRRDWLAGQFGPQLALARMQVTAQVIMEADSKEMVDKIVKTMKDNQYIDVAKEAYDLADAVISQSKVDK